MLGNMYDLFTIVFEILKRLSCHTNDWRHMNKRFSKINLSRAMRLALICTPVLTFAQSSFQVVPTPNGNHGARNNSLNAAASSSPSDIWAVGQTTIHFDGSQWTAFNAPMITGDFTS